MQHQTHCSSIYPTWTADLPPAYAQGTCRTEQQLAANSLEAQRKGSPKLQQQSPEMNSTLCAQPASIPKRCWKACSTAAIIFLSTALASACLPAGWMWGWQGAREYSSGWVDRQRAGWPQPTCWQDG